VFYIDSPVTVKKDDEFTVNLNVAKAKENPRELNVRLQFSLNGGATTSQYYRIS